MRMKFKERLAAVPPGGRLVIPPEEAGSELEGPAEIQNALTLEGGGCTVFAAVGPVLTIDTDGEVVIRNLHLETPASDKPACALSVKRCGSLILENVSVVGTVEGPSEPQVWELPRLLFWRLQPGESTSVEFTAPEPHLLRWDIEQVGRGEERHSRGTYEQKFFVRPEAVAGSPLRGTIALVRADGNAVGTAQVAGWVRHPFAVEAGRKAEKRPAPLRGVIPTVLALAMAALLLAGYGMLRRFRHDEPRITISPASLDFGTLWYGDDRKVREGRVLEVRSSGIPAESVDLGATLVLGSLGSQNSDSRKAIFCISNGVTEIRIPLEIDGMPDGDHSITGMVCFACTNAGVRVRPDVIPVAARIRSQRFSPSQKP